MSAYRAIAEYYDPEYEQLDMLQRDVPFFLERLPRRRRLSILELAAGTGRAAIPLAQAGHRITAVDFAPDMLGIARRKRDGVGLSGRQLELIRGNVLSLDLGRRFDRVCIFFNTFLNFTTLEDQDRVLQTVRRHLKRRGRFWLDIFQPNLELLAQHRSEHLDPCAFYVPSLERSIHRDTEVVRDPARQVQHIIFHYQWFDEMGVEQRQKVEFDLTFIFPRELRILLERNGLKIRQFWGDYDGSAVNMDSPRLIACCSML